MAWLFVLLHNAHSILTRGYPCPLETPISNSLTLIHQLKKGATATKRFCSPASRSGYAGCHTFCKSTVLPLLQSSFHSLRQLPRSFFASVQPPPFAPFSPHRCITGKSLLTLVSRSIIAHYTIRRFSPTIPISPNRSPLRSASCSQVSSALRCNSETAESPLRSIRSMPHNFLAPSSNCPKPILPHKKMRHPC